MKDSKKWILVSIVSLFVFMALLTGCSSESPVHFHELDWYRAGGNKLIAYDIANDRYTSQYIPSELCAKSVDEVGCILKLDIEYTGTTYEGITNGKVSSAIRMGEIIRAEIINLHTGEIMASENFTAEQPNKAAGPGTDHVDKEIIKQWVSTNYIAPKAKETLTVEDVVPLPKETIPEAKEIEAHLSPLAGNIAQIVPMPDGIIAVLYTDGKVKAVGDEKLSAAVSQWQNVKYLLSDVTHLAGLKENGTVVSSKFNASDWRNIEKLFCYDDKIAGITTDGEVRTAGNFKDGCDPNGLTNIQDICIFEDAVYAITTDGEVIQRNFAYIDPVIACWKNVEKLYACSDGLLAMFCNGNFESTDGQDVSALSGANRIVWDVLSEGWLGIADDGSLLVTSAVHDFWANCCRVPEDIKVKDIFALSYNHTALVMMDGTVTEIDGNRNFYCKNWESIEKIAAIPNSFGNVDSCYGLRSDGSVVKNKHSEEIENYENWDLVDLYECEDKIISFGEGETKLLHGGIVGLTKDGAIVAEGCYKQSNVDLLNMQP